MASMRCTLLLLPLLVGCPTAPDLPQGPDPCREQTQVDIVEFIDADTADVDILDGDLAGTTERIRLLGIDTPELNHSDLPDSEYCAVRAWNHAVEDFQGETAWLTFDTACTGTYGRTLAYLFRDSDELWFNKDMVDWGYARVSEMTFEFSFRTEFEAAEQEAMSAGVGLWGACDE